MRTQTWKGRAVLGLALLAGVALLPGARAQQADKDRAFAVVPQTGPLKGKQVYANSYALIVGINAYPNVPRKWWLNHAVDDARSVRDLLVRSYGFPPENITLLTDGDATEKKIRNALAGFTSFTRIKKDDRILVYFSGHGQTIKMPGEGTTEMGFLVPYDAEVDLGDLSNPEPYLRTCVPMRQVWEYLDASPAKHVLVLADACYSGLLAKNRAFGEEAISDAQLQSLAAERTRQVITAGRRGETAVELEALGHGAFTHSLLELLKKGAEIPGEVFTSNQLYTKLFPAVGKVTDGRQTPQLSNHDTEGQFLFIATPEVKVDNGPAAADTIARMFVRTNPPGAKIFVDGREFPEGKTPYTVAVGLGGDRVRNVEVVVELNGEQKKSQVALVAGRFMELPLIQFSGTGPGDNRRNDGLGGSRPPRALLPVLARRTDLGAPGRLRDTRTNPIDGAPMVWVPAGTFDMGSEDFESARPVHKVTISRGFWMYRTHVTVQMYEKFRLANPGAPKLGRHFDGNFMQPLQPANHVDYPTAAAYAAWAGGRLPTEAEWEYAARGTDGRMWPWGNEPPDRNRAHFGFGGALPAPVFDRPTSASWCGALDMAGNVTQWCLDWYGPYGSEAETDPAGPATGTDRVVRGGDWHSPAEYIRASARNALKPETQGQLWGFRIMVPGP